MSVNNLMDAVFMNTFIATASYRGVVGMRRLLIVLVFVMSGCNGPDKNSHTHDDAAAYTCPMHPEVRQAGPGVCPVCGMELVTTPTVASAVKAEIMLSDAQIQLGNISARRITSSPVGETILTNGRLAADQRNSEVISSRTDGRIEKLHIKETGGFVRKGQPLYTLYSEQLLTLQQEYLLASEQYETLGEREKRYKTFLDAAERKLLLYGMTRDQIARLDRNSLQPQVSFVAPTSGVVVEVNAAEGQYVREGAPLFRIENIGTLWVEAELYPGEGSGVRVGDKITVHPESGGDREIETTVAFLSPEYRDNTQLTVLRAYIDNPDNHLKPGQFVRIGITNTVKQALAAPVDAVIRRPEGAHVYVKAGRNTFRPQKVETGLESFDAVEITQGLAEGDTVVVTGAYLLYSEMVLKKGAGFEIPGR